MHFTFAESAKNASLRRKYQQKKKVPLVQPFRKLNKFRVDQWWGLEQSHYAIKSNNIVGFKWWNSQHGATE